MTFYYRLLPAAEPAGIPPIKEKLLWRVLSLSDAPMSKQDVVVPGLRVHLHQQGFSWGFGGVLISTGRKNECFGGVLQVGWEQLVSADLLFGILRIHVPHCSFVLICFRGII